MVSYLKTLKKMKQQKCTIMQAHRKRKLFIVFASDLFVFVSVLYIIYETTNIS